MPLTFDQLTTPKTTAQMRQQVLDGLNGRGVVTKTGTGTGSLSVAGTPAMDTAVLVQIGVTGEPGTATWQYSLDGGPYSMPPATIPSAGAVALGSTGCTIQFSAGPTGAGSSFVAGDLFAFSLSVPNFDVTAWQPGGVARTLVEIEAQALSDLTSLVAAVASGGFVDHASGAWLDLVASNMYGLTRNPATATQGMVVLSDTGGSGPLVIAPGQLWFASTNGLRFQGANTANVTLPKNLTLSLPVSAEVPGAAYNVGLNTITTLLTPLPGVNVNNPGTAGAWRTSDGRDPETDDALRARCKARWAALGVGGTADAYQLWATTASPNVTRTRIQASSTAGQVDIYLAGPQGPVTAGDVSSVAAYIAQRTPLAVIANVQNTTARSIAVTATLFGKPQYRDAALASAANSLQALVAATSIGGTVYRSALIEVLMTPGGVQNVSLSAPTIDQTLLATEVATLGTTTLTWTDLP